MEKSKATSHYLSNPELSAFAGQMALILKAGISSLEGIAILKDDSSDKKYHSVLMSIQKEMHQSGYLYKALEKSGSFPPYMVQMTRIGEETGNLDTVMESLSFHYNREEQIRRNTINSVVYPALMTAIMLAVILVLIVRVMPIFEQVFRELGAVITGPALLFINAGKFLRTYGITILLICAIILIGGLFSTTFEGGKKFWHNVGRHFRGIRKGYEEITICRFASAMSMAIASGLTPEQGLYLTMDLNEDADFDKKLHKVHDELSEGTSFSQCLLNNGIFSGLYAKMTVVGAKTGTLDTVLAQIADLCQEQVDRRLNNRLAAIEPVLAIILSLIVGAILFSVMFPLLGIMSSL
uniref:Type II secretory pathway, component PulF n=1 Tax=Eubacterium cellulosolvens (strain ATCC 43171 / JCM 9499 / 6) TaxID=633697 RepID=I5AU91_EUBC6